MDSPIQEVHIQIFDRVTETLTTGIELPGPVWYGKSLSDGNYLIQTSVEKGQSSKSNYVHIFVSHDLLQWRELIRFKKDFYPMRLFRFGIITFSSGHQHSSRFTFSGEAINQIDGKSMWGTL